MILAVDPGETTALAVYMGATPGVTSIADLTPAFALEFLTWARAQADARGEPLTLVIEDQHAVIRWVRKRGKMQPTIHLPSLISLVRSAEVWVVVAGVLGIPVVRVLASVWQGPMFRGAPDELDGKRLDSKGKARHVVAATWREVYRFTGIPEPGSMKLVKPSKLNEHIRDAMLMGRWYQLHGDARGE